MGVSGIPHRLQCGKAIVRHSWRTGRAVGEPGNKMYLGSLFEGPDKSVAMFMSAGLTDGKVELKVSGPDKLHVTSAFGVGQDLPVQGGRLPWVALTLALTFGLYGLLRKLAPLGALEGLSLETMLLAPFAFAVLCWMTWHGQGALARHDTTQLGWLVLAGPVTAIPLLLFAAGARRIPLSMMGILQYIAPSILVLLGVWLYGEPFAGPRVLGFVLIWMALALYTVEGWWSSQEVKRRIGH